MKKRINLRLILIAGIAVIVTMVCMTGIYYKLFQGQVARICRSMQDCFPARIV